MAQTSVEWIAERFKDTILTEYAEGRFLELIEEAKEMEKKQHGRTWDAALDACEKRGHVYVRAWEDFDEYYNEQYKKQ